MTSKRHKIETEIARYRNEGKWAKVEETTKNLSRKYGASDGAVVMLEAEVQLELYLLENPPRRENVSESKKKLQNVKIKLQEAMASDCKESSFSIKEESCMLLCKLLYAQGNTTPCLNMMKNIDFKKIGGNGAIPCYKLRLIAETYAFKGLSLEHSVHSKSLFDKDADQTTLESYELSAEFSLAYISECERLQGMTSTVEQQMSYAMELAFQRAPLLHIKSKNLLLGINKLRHSLKSFETRVTTVQQTLAKDLATVLLRGISEVTYESPSGLPNVGGSRSPKFSFEKQRTSSMAGGSPVICTIGSPVESVFSPTDCTQESILLLLITEAMLNSDPILDMSPEYADARTQLLSDSRMLYDLLAVALSKYRQYDMFIKSIEASLKYAYDEFHLWYQYGLSAMSAGKHDRALRIFMECCRIRPRYPAPYLLMAKICFETLDEIEQGAGYAEKALEAASAEDTSTDNQTSECDVEESSDYLAASHIAVGMGCCYQCVEGTPREQVADLRSKAIGHFEKAHGIDPIDHKPLLFMAIEMALDRRISEAVTKVKEALELQPHDLNCLHLLILLQTAQKQVKEPFSMLDTACKLYPENISLLITKCKLELYTGENEKALGTCNKMMQIWKNLHEAHINNALNAESMMERMTSDGRSVTNQSIGNELDIDAGSFIANSAALSRLDRALSGVESSLGDHYPRTVGVVSGHPWMLQARIWLLTSEVYATLERYDEAALCIKEASTLFPLSHEVLYTCGKLAYCQGDMEEASTMFKNTLAINPKHHKALLSWGQALLEQGKLDFAKKLLQDAAKLSPMNHEVWQVLGEVFQEKEDFDGAVECMSTSINLEATSPILPFTTVSRDL